jgi:hypothetical protein
VAERGEERGQHVGGVAVVVDDEDAQRHRHAFAGVVRRLGRRRRAVAAAASAIGRLIRNVLP